ncbi:MAG: hypothetical protein KDC44_12615, partial [Phaeodactylibacter sp.]|nr:hypothetical protein [Phaeodactylibacter sp.]
MLDGLGTTVWNHPEKLKYLLGPVIARSDAEQEKFYHEFDLTWKKLQDELAASKGGDQINRWRTRLAWLLIVLLGLALLSYFLIFKKKEFEFQNPPIRLLLPEDTSAHAPIFFYFPDSVAFKRYKEMAWEVRDTSGKEVLQRSTGHFSAWLDLGSRDRLEPYDIHFSYKWGPHHYDFTHEIIPACTYDQVLELQLPTTGLLNRAVNFGGSFTGRGIWTLKIDFGDREETTMQVGLPGKSLRAFPLDFSHTYRSEGQFKIDIKLESEDPILNNCQGIHRSRTIQVGQKVPVSVPPPLILEKEAYRRVATLRWGPIIAHLTFFSGLFTLLNFLLVSLRKRKKEEAAAAEQAAQEINLDAFQLIDGPPYNIPFRNQDAKIPVDEATYQFANALRRRQIGIQQRLDIPATVTATIGKAGMPSFQYSFGSRPSEYLFLIDRSSGQSHQARLMEFLARQLEEQDVLVHTYFYQENLINFWNEQTPNGLSLELLYRRYPEHRVVILGNAHHLLDPHNRRQENLRPYEAALLEHWSFRMLLTPVPPRDWGYQERELYRLFSIYPADTDGFLAASKLLDSLDEQPVERIPFKKWQSILIAERNDPTTNFRRWHRIETINDYLSDYPALWTWLASLSVFPELDWALTLAIGEDLTGFGVEVNFENLLILSRIDWMQEGEWPPRLRIALLEQLEAKNPVALRQARETVIREIKAVEPLTKNGHANQEAQKQLAMQQHLLAPEDEHQRAILQALLDQGFLTAEEELEIRMERTQDADAVLLTRLDQVERTANAGDLEQALKLLIEFTQEHAPDYREATEQLLMRAFETPQVMTKMDYIQQQQQQQQ